MNQKLGNRATRILVISETIVETRFEKQSVLFGG